MTREEEVILERRLTTLEMGIEEVKRNSDERLEVITARFDKIDRRAMLWVNAAFVAALAVGGIYLEAYISKEQWDSRTTLSVVDGV
jgi:hypothetical protein